jgi:hypothetical protein
MAALISSDANQCDSDDSGRRADPFLMRRRPIHLHAGDQYNNALQRPMYGYRKALGEAQLEHPVSAKYKLRFCLQFHGLYLTLTTLTVRPDRRVLVVLRH